VAWAFQPAVALDPNRLTSQYVRELWGAQRGLPGGQVHAIAQTPDGYLWIGTDSGLVRFDGFNFRSIPLSSTAPVSNAPVLGLVVDGDGNLWVEMQGAGLLRQRDGKLEAVPLGLGRSISQVTAISKGTNGGVLLSDVSAGLLLFRGEQSDILAHPTLLPGSSPLLSMAQSPDGKVWAGTLGAGLFYIEQGRASHVASNLPDRKINCLLAVGDHELWIGTDNGLYRWDGTVLSSNELPLSRAGAQVLAMLRDRDSNIWVGTTKGLLRINSGGTEISEETELRGNGGINALLEDREGNIWVGGTRGLERIRDTAFVTYLPADGLPSESNGPVYIDPENRVWFAPAEGGLYTLKNGRVQTIKLAQLDSDVIYSITGKQGVVWVGRQRAGLTRLQFTPATVTARSYTKADGLAQNSVYAVYQSTDGALWAGTLSAGVSKFKDGRFTTYSTANGLASNTVTSILETRDKTIWFATPNGLSSLSNGRWEIYAVSEGLPSENVNCLFEDSSGVLWIGTSAGLAFFSAGHFQIPQNLPEALQEQIYGIAEDQNGWFWIAGAHRVLRAKREILASGTPWLTDIREYGPEDGLRSSDGVKRSKSVIADPLGRIWFSLSRGLSVVYPAHLTQDSAPAIAHVEAIFADGIPISTEALLRVPASPKRITFRYTGLSLAVPDRVRFRYFLEGFDRSWSEPVASREAVYTNLGAGPYRFHLVASNSDGLWNSAESALAFKIDPALWQTWWFRLSSVLLFVLAMLTFFRLRVRTMRRQMNMRFEERLAERTRIAQELHDTLLQGFLSASMQLHVVNDHLDLDSTAKPLVNRVLELMGRVIEEGRNALRGLRLSSGKGEDLEQAFSQIPEEVGAAHDANFRVLAEGAVRRLHPVIREEVYRIGHEALVNAFRHSQASNIELELEYAPSHLRLLVRDNGRGIDPEVVRVGRDGHWGLSGMRERAERIGARFRVLSGLSAGTEVELSVPAHIAFDLPSSPTRRKKSLPALNLRKWRRAEKMPESEKPK
jgi:ligand-binding sensor domain-containing protein/signal transduction histidine kinase